MTTLQTGWNIIWGHGIKRVKSLDFLVTYIQRSRSNGTTQFLSLSQQWFCYFEVDRHFQMLPVILLVMDGWVGGYMSKAWNPTETFWDYPYHSTIELFNAHVQVQQFVSVFHQHDSSMDNLDEISIGFFLCPWDTDGPTSMNTEGQDGSLREQHYIALSVVTKILNFWISLTENTFYPLRTILFLHFQKILAVPLSILWETVTKCC